jgi:small subunit ribosomal protein S16
VGGLLFIGFNPESPSRDREEKRRGSFMVKIRLTRGGRISRPVYTIVAVDSRSPRDGKFLEKLGQYDPLVPEGLKRIKTESLAKWIKSGAHLSDTVRSLLKKHKIALNS